VELEAVRRQATRDRLAAFGAAMERVRGELRAGRSVGHVVVSTVMIEGGLVAYHQHRRDHAATASQRRDAELAARYRPGSMRYKAAASALAYLQADGVGLDRVVLAGQPVARPARRPAAEVSFNTFLVYQVASTDRGPGWRHLHVWPTPRSGRWLAVDLRVQNGASTQELYWHLNPIYDSRENRYDRIRHALGTSPLDASAQSEQQHSATGGAGPGATPPSMRPGK
jgi:hypothetical protein